MMVGCEGVLRARERIREYVYRVPLELCPWLTLDNAKVYLKLECRNRLKTLKGGSIK
jgi:threonine dehydratase